jgi:hypothetical protein
MVMDTIIVGSAFGLVLICIGWLLQIISSWKGDRKLRKRTLIFYCLGVAVLIINSVFVAKTFDIIALLNIVTLILALILLTDISRKGKKNERTIVTKKRKRR